jgi:hypothetical protein
MNINFELCKQLNITEDELIYLYSVLYCKVDIQKLTNLGYIDGNGVLSDDICRKLSPNTTVVSFNSIYDLYPHKVNNRVLKAVKHDTGDYSYCFSKFKYYINKDPNVASKMLKGLTIELGMRERGSSQQFQQDVKTWFNQRTWEKYCDLEVDEEVEKVDRI